MSDTSWLYGGSAPESEAVQAEREIIEDIVRNEVASGAKQRSQAVAEATLQAVHGTSNTTLDERVAAASAFGCDNCSYEGGELYHNEATGLSLCERCDSAVEQAFTAKPQTTATWKRLKSGAWGITGPSALLRSGAQVQVIKRDGRASVVTVGRVLWSGDGKAIATARR